MNKYLVELIGTFFIVFTVGLGSNPLSVGFAYISLIYLGYNISGAHYNPAISLIMFLKKKLDFKNLSFYVLFQISGACLAALSIHMMKSNMQIQPVLADSIYSVLFMEAIFTFLIVLIYLRVTGDNYKNNSYYGLAIGLPLIAGIFSAAPVSSAVFNPAVSIGPSIIDIITDDGVSQYFLWYYIIGPVLGAVIAFVVDKFIDK